LNYTGRHKAEVIVGKSGSAQLCEVVDDDVLKRLKDAEGTGRGPFQYTNPKYAWRN